MKLNIKLTPEKEADRDVTKDFPSEVSYIAKKHGLEESQIYICDHCCGEATIFSLENGEIKDWLGYIDYNFQLEKSLSENQITLKEYYEKYRAKKSSNTWKMSDVQKGSY